MPAVRRIVLAIAVGSQFALPAQAAARHAFAVAPGPLGNVLRAIADQGGGEIGFPEALVQNRRSAGVQGSMSMRAALARVLQLGDLRARAIGADRFVIEVEAAKSTGPTAPRPSVVATGQSSGAIIVTGSKRATTELRYPGAVRVIPLGTEGARPDIATTADLVARAPLLQSTAFGPGRDKLFIRGVADSSFAGPTQATVGHYFGDTRLLYSGPDPALRLVDVQQIEILEGPQGGLYGAGAIGGIVRIVPRAPDVARFGYAAGGSIAATQSGRIGGDVDLTANVPIVTDRVALRAVGYHACDGGYIDDPTLHLSNINTSCTDGGRAALRAAPGAGWTIDLDGLAQRIASDDPQYATRGIERLASSARLRQPYRDVITLGSVGVRHEIADGPSLLATFGVVQRGTRLRYDASRPPPSAPIAYDEHVASTLFDGELRLWRTKPSGSGWLLGISAVENRTAARRQLGPPGSPRDISGVDDRSLDLALFGERTVVLWPGILVTAGGRLTHARIDGQPLAARPQSSFILGDAHTRLDPTASFSAQLATGLSLYGRYARGFRAGGLAVAAGAGRVSVYQSDSISTVETGLRAEGLFGGKLSGTIGLSNAWWQNIQADLVARNGFPFTANIGDGRLLALEARLAYSLAPRLVLNAEGLLTRSRLVHPAPAYSREGGDDLPDTPRFGAAVGMTWYPPIDDSRRFQVAALLRRQGRSRFGDGPLFGIDQKGYMMGDASATLRRGRYVFGASIENLTNDKGNRFAIGNPFPLQLTEQYTPLRPRTFRLSFTVSG